MGDRTYIKQYNPVSAYEISNDDALSVRAVSDTIDNLLNLIGHICNHKVVYEIGNPLFETEETDENRVVMYLGKHFIPPGYYGMQYWLQAYLSNGTPSTDFTTFTLVASRSLYRRTEAFDTAYVFDSQFTYATEVITLGTVNRAYGTIDIPFTNTEYYLLLLAENSAASGVQSKIISLDIQLYMPLAES